MQWDKDNGADMSHITLIADPPISYINPSPASTYDDRKISNSQDLIGIRPSLGLMDTSINAIGRFVSKEMLFKHESNKPTLSFDNDLRLPLDPMELSTGEFLDSVFPLTEQFQFSAIANSCSNLRLEQISRQTSISKASISPNRVSLQ